MGRPTAPSPAHTLHFQWEFTKEDPNYLTGCLQNSRCTSLRAYIFMEVYTVQSFTPVQNGSKKLILRSWAVLDLRCNGTNSQALENGPNSLLTAHSRPTKPFPDYIQPHHLPINQSTASAEKPCASVCPLDTSQLLLSFPSYSPPIQCTVADECYLPKHSGCQRLVG